MTVRETIQELIKHNNLDDELKVRVVRRGEIGNIIKDSVVQLSYVLLAYPYKKSPCIVVEQSDINTNWEGA